MKAEIWLGEYFAAADQALDAKDCVFRVGDRLAFRRLADKALVVGEGDDRRRGARAFGVFDHTRLDPSLNLRR